MFASACAGSGYAAWRARARLAYEFPHAWEGRDIAVSGWVKGLPSTSADGTRWRLHVRLKRAHGNANWGVRDAEAALLARDIRATGYVSAPLQAVRLPGRAHGIGVTVDGWRAAIRERIAAVLGDAPHYGIVVARAIGAQDAVSAAAGC